MFFAEYRLQLAQPNTQPSGGRVGWNPAKNTGVSSITGTEQWRLCLDFHQNLQFVRCARPWSIMNNHSLFQNTRIIVCTFFTLQSHLKSGLCYRYTKAIRVLSLIVAKENCTFANPKNQSLFGLSLVGFEPTPSH